MKEKLTRNIGLKLISIALAVFFWFVINGFIDPVTTTTIDNVPVRIINQDAMDSVNKLMEVTSGDKVSVKVRTKRSVANTLTVSDFEAIADVTNKNEFNAVPIIVTCKTHGDDSLEIISHATENGTTMLHLTLVDLIQRSFGVAIITDGNVKEGYYITNSTVSPNLITITGSETQLAKVARVAVIIGVDGASRDISQNCAVQAYDAEGNVVSSENLNLSENQVKIDMTILPTKEVEVVINALGTPADGYYLKSLEFAPHYMTVAGKTADLALLSRIMLNYNVSDADVDLESTLDVAAALYDRYGDALTIVNETKLVSVRADIEKFSQRTISISTDRITQKNLGEGLSCEIVPSTVDLVIRGPEEAIKKVVSSDIKAYIDLSFAKNSMQTATASIQVEPIEGITVDAVTVDIVVKSVSGD